MATKKERFIYLAYWRKGNLLKIGSSIAPLKRLQSYRTQLGRHCYLVGKWPGTIREEHVLHRRFKEYALGQEWFRFEGALCEFVKYRFETKQ